MIFAIAALLAAVVMVYSFFYNEQLALFVTSFLFVLLAFAASAQAQPKTEIEEFITGPGPDKSTLVVVCASGRRVEIVLSNKFIKERNIDTIYSKLMEECSK